MSYGMQRADDVPLNMAVPDVARAFAASGMFKDARDEAQAITKILAGRSIGLDPFSSMSGLHVMQGKVEIGSHLIAGAIRRHPDYDYRVLAHTDTVCRIAFFRRGDQVGESEYTIADAETAQLTRNPTWKKHPKAMLFARAISSGYRWHCPDVFSAPVYAEGELGEEPPAAAIKTVAATVKPVRVAPEPVEAEPVDGVEDAKAAAAAACKTLADSRKEEARRRFRAASRDPVKLRQLAAWAAEIAAADELEDLQRRGSESETERREPERATQRQLDALLDAQADQGWDGDTFAQFLRDHAGNGDVDTLTAEQADKALAAL